MDITPEGLIPADAGIVLFEDKLRLSVSGSRVKPEGPVLKGREALPLEFESFFLADKIN
ncbi:hypothetical protein D3C73_1573550 [compost metagenome]